MALLRFILLLLVALCRIQAKPTRSDYDVYRMAPTGSDDVEAQVVWEKVYMGRGPNTIKGNAFFVENPINHFSFQPPLKGCGNGVVLPSETARAHNCVVATNGGFFDQPTTNCIGNLVSDSKVIQYATHQNVNFGITADNNFIVGYISESTMKQLTSNKIHGGLKHMVSGVVWLVRKGANFVRGSLKTEDMGVQDTGGSFATTRSARTAIGHDADGRLLIVTIDGKTWDHGVNLYEFADVLIKLGAVNAINLDGGGSESAVVNGTQVSVPSDMCRLGQGHGGHGFHNRHAQENKLFSCMRPVTSITCVHHLQYTDLASAAASTQPAFSASHPNMNTPTNGGSSQSSSLIEAGAKSFSSTKHRAPTEQTPQDLRDALTLWRSLGIAGMVLALVAIAVSLALCVVYAPNTGMLIVKSENSAAPAKTVSSDEVQSILVGVGVSPGAGSDVPVKSLESQMKTRQTVFDDDHDVDDMDIARDSAKQREEVFGADASRHFASAPRVPQPFGSNASATVSFGSALPLKPHGTGKISINVAPPSAQQSTHDSSAEDLEKLQRELESIATDRKA